MIEVKSQTSDANAATVSEVSLVCDDVEFKIDQEKMVAQSQVLKAGMDGPFTAATSKRIVIKDTSPSAVAIMAGYINRGKSESYLTESLNNYGKIQGLETHSQVYFLTDRYTYKD